MSARAINDVQQARDRAHDQLVAVRTHLGALLIAIESGDVHVMRIAAEMAREELANSAPHILATVASLRRAS